MKLPPNGLLLTNCAMSSESSSKLDSVDHSLQPLVFGLLRVSSIEGGAIAELLVGELLYFEDDDDDDPKGKEKRPLLGAGDSDEFILCLAGSLPLTEKFVLELLADELENEFEV